MTTGKHRAAVAAEAAVQVDPPTEYYTSRYSGEEIDKGIDGALQLGGASTPQGAIAALGAGVRPNLLVNPFFKVNQRGQTSYTGEGYTVDMWRITGSRSTLDVTEDGITFSVSAEDTSRRYIGQKFETGAVKSGVDYTLSVLLQSGELYSGTAQFPANSGSYNNAFTIPGIGDGRLNVGNNGVKEVYFIVDQGSSLSLRAAKFEEGARQTFAYKDEDGAWQFLERPDPLEVLKCQRYQFTFANAMRIRASRITNSEINFFIPLPTGLRTTPTIVNAQNLQVYSPTGGAAQTGFAFSCPSGSAAFGNGVTIVATKSSHGLQDAFLYTNTPGGANLITLDANL